MKRTRLSPVLALSLAVGLALSALTMTACGDDTGDGSGTGSGDGTTSAADLQGVTWVLTSYLESGASTTTAVPTGVRVDLLFGPESLGGSAPVNSYTAPYTAGDDGTIEIGPIAGTLMAGEPKAMAIEQAYFAALERATAFRIEADNLVLEDSAGAPLLSFIPESTSTLTGRTWNVTGYNNGKEAVVSTIAGSMMTAVFADDSTVSGKSGVNTYSGSCVIEGNDIRVGELALTRMAGPDDLMEQEQLYLAALRSAATWSLRGDVLELRTADDAIAVVFAAGK